jgi:hypothetical protein
MSQKIFEPIVLCVLKDLKAVLSTTLDAKQTNKMRQIVLETIEKDFECMFQSNALPQIELKVLDKCDSTTTPCLANL